ncbi:twitching motility protein PilT [Nitrosopumilus sp. K4]|uniref:PIN domain-containing protein n=1 Tax=Nitrosopumilus sp. K4 TaxID=2795383 RepID=UPI001BA50B21|nr:PIN domain-containing protein [Nitrosopumilus sp. K4]QUC64497.1 twitching motility protein PilT [Nitrosopumilus sp. K4]
MVEVICDTSFLIHLATKRIKNIDTLDTEIGSITFTIPQVVLNELNKLEKIPEKQQDISRTLNYIKKFKVIPIKGSFADKELIEYIKNHRSIVATIDKELKKQIKNHNGSIMSFSNDRIILES